MLEGYVGGGLKQMGEHDQVGTRKSERRGNRRFSISVPIGFEWKTLGGDFRRTRGTTCDISTSGVFAYVDHPLAAGLGVHFDITFPTDLTGGRPMKFRCQGTVIRSWNLGNLFGIATSIKNRQLLDPKLHLRSYSRVVPSSIITAVLPEYLMVRKAVRDLHRAGAFIEISGPLPVGQEVELLFHGPDLPAEIKVRAVVRRLESTVGVGVEFVAVSEEADRLLRQFTRRTSDAA